MLVQQVQTKSINGADGRALQQHPLAAQHGIAGLQLAAVQQRLPDAGTQLCRRRIGKGDDEQPVGIDRLLRVGDQLHRPLGQHGGLTAACGCTYQQRTAPVGNGGLLRRGPFVKACEELSKLLVSHNAKGGRIAAICAAPSALGILGILEGKNATCYPGFEDQLKGAKFKAVPVVTDGNITTSRGMGTSILLGLELVKLLKDEETSKKLAEAIMMP